MDNIDDPYKQDRQEVEKKPIVEIHMHYTRKGTFFLARRQDSDDWEEVIRSYEDEALMNALMKQAEGKRERENKPNGLLAMVAVALTFLTIYMYYVTL